jgi:hypothetical protein
MSSKHDRLNKIVSLARKARPITPAPTDETAPLGFATRVAAQWVHSSAHSHPSPADVWERISWWGSGLAAAACVVALAIHLADRQQPTGFDMLLGAPTAEQTF